MHSYWKYEARNGGKNLALYQLKSALECGMEPVDTYFMDTTILSYTLHYAINVDAQSILENSEGTLTSGFV